MKNEGQDFKNVQLNNEKVIRGGPTLGMASSVFLYKKQRTIMGKSFYITLRISAIVHKGNSGCFVARVIFKANLQLPKSEI